MRGHHLTERGTFKSDKYEWCPEGYFALKVKDPLAQGVILHYADVTLDEELAFDLRKAVKNARSKPDKPQVPRQMKTVTYTYFEEHIGELMALAETGVEVFVTDTPGHVVCVLSSGKVDLIEFDE